MIKEFNRRHFIKAAGAFLPLPFLSSLAKAGEQKSSLPFKRAVFINLGHGMMPHNFFPEKTGRDYKSSVYLKNLDSVRDRFTVFSGLSHRGISNHTESQGFLTGFPHGNSVSVDQLMSKTLSRNCRFESIGLSPFNKSGGGGVGLSYNRSGIGIPPLIGPQSFYMKLFSEGSAKEKKVLLKNLETNKSVLDGIKTDRDSLKRNAGSRDKQELEEYYQAVREAEIKLTRNIKWLDTPKPKAPFKYKEFPQKIFDLPMLEEFLGLETELMYLALKTDSTRVITLHYAVNDNPLEIDGANTNAHRTYSHHNSDPAKMKTLTKIENSHFKKLAAEFIIKLSKKENGSSLLDDTMVMAGSNLGNPPNHSGNNLPIIVAGAGFEKYHGSHIGYDKNNNEPLCNLYLTMLYKLGIEREKFAIGSGTLRGIDS